METVSHRPKEISEVGDYGPQDHRASPLVIGNKECCWGAAAVGRLLLGALGGRKMRSFLCIPKLVLEISFLRLMGWDCRLGGVVLEASVGFPSSVG